MNILGLIPARGGSKSIPHKNIVLLAGKPMLAYTCEAALQSAHINRVVLSTDDPAIAEVGRACGIEVPFMRPDELARDDTPSLAVAQHAISWLKQHADWHTDILVLLQPTSPLRRAKHIDEALEIMFQQNADTVVSVVEVPHRYSPYSIMGLKDGKLQDFWTAPLPFDRYRRQDMPTFYARNGPSVLVTKSDVVLRGESFYGENIYPYIMEERVSIDIDMSLDLLIAEVILRQSV